MAKIITQSDYTRTLVRKRNDLADNIETKGVEADQTEKLNTLVPKVLEIGISQEVLDLFAAMVETSAANPSVGDYAEALEELRQELAALLQAKNIPVSDSDTYNTLIAVLRDYPWSATAAKWVIVAALNGGYPYYTNFVGIIPDVWDDTEPHNPSLWRINAEYNGGYPYTYYMKQWVEV